MAPLPPSRSRTDPPAAPLPLSGLLQALIGELGVEERLAQTRVLLAWEEAAGPLVAAQAQPLRITRGRLELAVPSATWRNQLSFMKHDLLLRLNHVAGEEVIRDLVFLNQPADRHPLAARSRERVVGANQHQPKERS